ncbi:hypothetical protein ABN763_05270 [Spongiivirga sp. MCCC 1A20706]|uniref:hypothetical protein n=1 Tax=Spongiivirga sp. MCCC 1A20706 TaxID=3160963 RepID=UPI003977271F
MSNHRKNRAKRHLENVFHDFMDVVDYLQQKEVHSSKEMNHVKSILISIIADLQTYYPTIIKKSTHQKSNFCILQKMKMLYHFHLPIKSSSSSFRSLILLYTRAYDEMLLLIDNILDTEWDIPIDIPSKHYKSLTIEDVFCLLIPNEFELQFLDIIRVIERNKPAVD